MDDATPSLNEYALGDLEQTLQQVPKRFTGGSTPPYAATGVGRWYMAAEGKFQAFGRSQSHVLKELDAIRESQKQIFLQHMQLELKHRFSGSSGLAEAVEIMRDGVGLTHKSHSLAIWKRRSSRSSN